MKKVMLCVFSLVLLLLVFCTAVSFRIEDWMTPDVVPVKGSEGKDPDTKDTVPLCPAEAVFTDDDGTFVYAIEEASGWQTSRTVTRIQLDAYRFLSSTAITSPRLSAHAQYVRFSSKPLTDGARVRLALESESAPGQVLLRLAEPGADTDETESILEKTGFTVLKTDREYILAETDALDTPFFADELQARCTAEGLTIKSSYSLRDFAAFCDALLPLALSGVLFGAAVFLWGFFCRAVQAHTAARYTLWIGIAAAIGGSVAVLFPISLPSSVLPERQIFDFPAYTAEMQALFTGLHAVGASPLADELRGKIVFSFVLLLASYLLFLLLFLAICRFMKLRTRALKKGKDFAA